MLTPTFVAIAVLCAVIVFMFIIGIASAHDKIDRLNAKLNKVIKETQEALEEVSDEFDDFDGDIESLDLTIEGLKQEMAKKSPVVRKLKVTAK